MPDPYLHEAFDKPEFDPRLQWYFEPAKWSVDPSNGCLRIEPDSGTDYWQRTHYGIEADNGHFLFANLLGDFVLTTQVRFHPVFQFDQAGLMVRISPSCWLKTSVEYEPDRPSRLGVVVTNHGYSDWSTQDFTSAGNQIQLRIHRMGSDYLVEAAEENQDWKQLRLAHLHEDREGTTVRAGLYACSPKGAGFVVEFDFLRIEMGRAS